MYWQYLTMQSGLDTPVPVLLELLQRCPSGPVAYATFLIHKLPPVFFIKSGIFS
jgi:hypothetical protein